MATRIAEMQHIPSEGNKFFFDFKVLAYPKQDNDSLMKILRPLAERNEVPFHKWVALSDDINALNSLSRGNDAENWQSIVEALSKPPMQFIGDSFWRLKEPFRGRVGRLIQPTYVEERVSLGEDIEVRKVTSLYDLHEGDMVSIEFISQTSRGSEDLDAGPKKRISITYDEDSPLGLVTASSFDIRSYRSEIVKVRAQHSENLDERSAMVQFITLPAESDWPAGPQVSLQFRVNKRGWQLFLSIGLLALGSLLVFIAGKIWENNPVSALVVAILGFLFLIAKELLMSRRIPAKL